MKFDEERLTVQIGYRREDGSLTDLEIEVAISGHYTMARMDDPGDRPGFKIVSVQDYDDELDKPVMWTPEQIASAPKSLLSPLDMLVSDYCSDQFAERFDRLTEDSLPYGYADAEFWL